jgi:hypothetical protein
MAEDELYSAIEAAIIRWNLDGTKTAGELTREIIIIIKNYEIKKEVIGKLAERIKNEINYRGKKVPVIIKNQLTLW